MQQALKTSCVVVVRASPVGVRISVIAYLLLHRHYCSRRYDAKILLTTAGEYISNKICVHQNTLFHHICWQILWRHTHFDKIFDREVYEVQSIFSLATFRERKKGRVEQKNRLLWSDNKHFETDPLCKNNQKGFFLLLCRTIIQMQALEQHSLSPLVVVLLWSVFYSQSLQTQFLFW